MAQGTLASGTGAFVGIAAQAGTWAAGTSGARTQWLPVLSFGGGLEQKTQRRNDLTMSASPRGYWKAGKLTKFTTSHLMDFGGLVSAVKYGHEMWLKRAFGTAASVQHEATDGYIHTFTLANTKTLATVERCLDSALATPKTPSILCPACMITAVEFEGNLFDPIKVTYEYIGRDEDALAVASAAPVFPPDNLVVPCVGTVGGQMTINSTNYIITKWKVRIEDPMADGVFQIGLTQTMAQPTRQEQRKVTGEFTCYFDDTDAPVIYALYKNSTEMLLVFDYQAGEILTAHNYQFSLAVWRAVATGKPPEVSGPGPVELTIPFEAYYDVTNARDAAQLVIWNTNTYTAGVPIP